MLKFTLKRWNEVETLPVSFWVSFFRSRKSVVHAHMYTAKFSEIY